MNYKSVFFAIFFIAMVVHAFSLGTGMVILSLAKDNIDGFFENGSLKAEVLAQANANADNVPEQVFTLFGNKKINLYIQLDDGSIREYYVKTGAKTLEQLSIGTKPDADLEVRIKEPTVDRIVLSQDPVKELTGAINSGEIVYKGLTTGGQVNSIIVNFGSAVFGFFDGIFTWVSGFLK